MSAACPGCGARRWRESVPDRVTDGAEVMSLRFDRAPDPPRPIAPLLVEGCDGCGAVEWTATSVEGLQGLRDVIRWTPPTPCARCSSAEAILVRWTEDAPKATRPAVQDWQGWGGRLRASVCLECRRVEWAARGLDELDPIVEAEPLPTACACGGARFGVTPLDAGEPIVVRARWLRTDVCRDCGAIEWRALERVTEPPPEPETGDAPSPRPAPRARVDATRERAAQISRTLTQARAIFGPGAYRGRDDAREHPDEIAFRVPRGSLMVELRAAALWEVTITCDPGALKRAPTTSRMVRLARALRRAVGRAAATDPIAADARWAQELAPGAAVERAGRVFVVVIAQSDAPSAADVARWARAAHARASGEAP